MRRRKPRVVALLVALVVGIFFESTSAWEWADLLGASAQNETLETLNLQQISELHVRARDIKRRLARNYGYSADELGRMLDKKELIQALAFEEHKVQMDREEAIKRRVVKRGILTAIIAVVVVMCWPVIQHGYEVAAVNFVVYTDRKKLEAKRCWELQSLVGMVGITIMFFIDLMQVWLTGSILLSWVTRSKYFFPVPSIPIRPAQFMSGPISQSTMANYGVNVGPMAVGWIMRFVYARVEAWTGQALSRAHKAQRRAARASESEEEKAARKAARKQAKREARAEAAQVNAMASPESTLPPDWMQPTNDPQPFPTPETPFRASGESPEVSPVPNSRAHQEFLQQLEEHTPELDDLD